MSGIHEGRFTAVIDKVESAQLFTHLSQNIQPPQLSCQVHSGVAIAIAYLRSHRIELYQRTQSIGGLLEIGVESCVVQGIPALRIIKSQDTLHFISTSCQQW